MTAVQPEPTFWQSICWPVIICLLLGGHMMIMLVAMTLALADPPEEAPSFLPEAKPARPAVLVIPSETADPHVKQR